MGSRARSGAGPRGANREMQPPIRPFATLVPEETIDLTGSVGGGVTLYANKRAGCSTIHRRSSKVADKTLASLPLPRPSARDSKGSRIKLTGGTGEEKSRIIPEEDSKLLVSAVLIQLILISQPDEERAVPD